MLAGQRVNMAASLAGGHGPAWLVAERAGLVRAEVTGGASIPANRALALHEAEVGAQPAVALHSLAG